MDLFLWMRGVIFGGPKKLMRRILSVVAGQVI